MALRELGVREVGRRRRRGKRKGSEKEREGGEGRKILKNCDIWIEAEWVRFKQVYFKIVDILKLDIVY